MNNNSNNCGDCGTTCSECGRPWAICKQDGGCGCNKCKDIKFCEYGRMANGCIREKQPGCPMQAVIPSVTVESIEGIKNLADCLVHVSDINTTFYIDDKHRPIITWAGPIDIPGYDMEGNPNNYRDQIVTDVANQIAVIYDKSGKGYLFGLAENIDLQEQVNNKLDEMAEDGALQEIIGDYLDATAVWGFDTVADMQDATNLINGSYAKTLGFHAKNDGGGATYKIRNVTNDDVVDERTIIAMNDAGNNLVAELIVNNNEINVNQFGAYGDGTHDDTTAIQASIDYASAHSGTVRLLNKTYIITNLTLTGHISIIGQGQDQSVLKAKASATGNMITSSEFGWLYIHLSDFKIDGNKDNATMTNGLYIDRGADYNNAKDSCITVERLLVSNVSGDGIYNGRGGRENRFINVLCEYCGGNGINNIASDSYFEGITCSFNTKNGLHVGSSACRFINIKCFLNGYNNNSDNREEIAGFCIDGYNNLFSECDAQENYGDGFYIKQGPNNFVNCLADANGFKCQRYNPDGSFADMTDEELVYDGFHITSPTWYVRLSTFIVTATDHRRSAHHQLQRYGVNMGNCQKCVFNIMARDNVESLHYDSTYQINQNYYGADNNIILNGVTIGTSMIDRIAMMNDANTRNAIDFFTGTDNTKKIRVTSSSTDIFQFDNMNGNTYKDTPFSIRLNDTSDGVISLGDSNSNYAINLRPKGLGFFGKSPVAQQTSVANATDLASCITLCNALKTKLQNYGLIASD